MRKFPRDSKADRPNTGVASFKVDDRAPEYARGTMTKKVDGKWELHEPVPSDEAVLSNGTRIRVVGNNIFVRPDPIAEKSAGGILFGAGAMEHIQNTGTVIAVGHITAETTEKVPIPGIKKGDRVAYVRFLEKQDTNVQLKGRLGDDVVRLRPADIQVIFDEEDLPKFRPDLAVDL